MGIIARQTDDPFDDLSNDLSAEQLPQGKTLARRSGVGAALPPGGPVMVRANSYPGVSLKLVDSSEGTKAPGAGGRGAAGKRKEGAVIRGLRDLQELQKQTVAVLEAVRTNLEEIHHVLRSPEATRGMEKQNNAATLLAKGFAQDAVQQATGAVELLPAAPDAHLLLSLSLAADQQFDGSLGAARKGLALFDRRQHPLAIEAGLLHAIAAMGHGAEAAERWAQIIEGMPVAVLLENLARMAVCYPADAAEGELDELVERRVLRKGGAGEEVPAGMLFAGLDAAQHHRLTKAHRVLLGVAAGQLNGARDATEVVRYLSEYVLPLANRGMERSSGALGKAAAKRLLALHADAMVLHRAMGKLQMAGAGVTVGKIAELLAHWRWASKQQTLARRAMVLGAGLLLGGVAIFGYVLWGLEAIYGKTPVARWGDFAVDAIWLGPAIMLLGAGMGIMGLMRRYPSVELPHNRQPLSVEERTYLETAEVRRSLQSVLRG